MLQSAENNQRWPTSGPGGNITAAALGSQTLRSRGQNHKWPTSGLGGYITRVPNALECGKESREARRWAGWLPPKGECLPGAPPARYLSINYPDFSPRFTL